MPGGRAIAGGGLTTEKNPRHPGFLHNMHAFFHRRSPTCRGTATWSSPGKHTAFMWEKLPYRVDGDPANCDRTTDAHGQDMLKVWRCFAPNLESAVIDRFTRSPLDVERTFPNMRCGDVLVGAFGHDQMPSLNGVALSATAHG